MQIQLPPLNDGEVYLHGIVDANGDIEHTVIVAVSNKRMSRDKQREYAKSLGGVLANRIDSIEIYRNHRGLVQEAAYWTDEDVEWDSEYAWCQGFNNGDQSYDRKSAELRAVVVRRFKN